MVSLEFVAIRCADPEHTRAFYESVGLRFEAEQHDGGPAHFAARLGSTIVELYPARPGGANLQPATLGLAVPDLDEVEQRLRTAGHVTRRDTDGMVLVATDPDGRQVRIASS